MGTGKSVVGKLLVRILKMNFVNTDDIIEKNEKRPIAKIFADSGETYFRKVEKEAVKEASGLKDAVIAAGGGVVLDEENIKSLKKNGVLICLNASPEVIYERTKGYKHRPLLNVGDPIKKIKELLDYRRPFYAKADYQVDTSKKTVAEVAKEIIGIVNA